MTQPGPPPLEAVGCWLWDHFRVLTVAAIATNVALTPLLHHTGAWGGIALFPGAVLLASLVVGRWANECRRGRRYVRRLVIDLGDEVHDELQLLAGEAGCSISELLHRSVALHRFVWMHRDADLFTRSLDDEPVIQRALGRRYNR